MASVSLRLTELPYTDGVALTDLVYIVTNPALIPISNSTTVQTLANVVGTGLPFKPSYGITAVPVRIAEGGTEAATVRGARDNLLIFDNAEYLRMKMADAAPVTVMGLNPSNALELGNALIPSIKLLSPIELTTPLAATYGGVPPGGAQYTVLSKSTAADYATYWTDTLALTGTIYAAGNIETAGGFVLQNSKSLNGKTTTNAQVPLIYINTDNAIVLGDNVQQITLYSPTVYMSGGTTVGGALHAVGNISTGGEVQSSGAIRMPQGFYLSSVSRAMIGFDGTYTIIGGPTYHGGNLTMGATLFVPKGPAEGAWIMGGDVQLIAADASNNVQVGGNAANVYLQKPTNVNGTLTVSSIIHMPLDVSLHGGGWPLIMATGGPFVDVGGWAQSLLGIRLTRPTWAYGAITIPKGPANGAWLMGGDVQLIGSDVSSNVQIGGNANAIYLQRATFVNGAVTASTGFNMPIDIYAYGGGYPLIAAATGGTVDIGGWALSVTAIRLSRPTVVHGTLTVTDTANFAGGAYMYTDGALRCKGVYNITTSQWYTVPDYIFEHAYTGRIEKFAQAHGAADYDGLRPLADVEAYTREHWHLPHHESDEVFRKQDDLLADMERIYLYLFEHERRLAAMEAR